MTNISAIPHNRLTYGMAEARAVATVVKSGQWACGKKVAELEVALARSAQVTNVVCVGSGLGALRLALLASGISAGDEVIVPAYSCVALANAVLSLGAKPVAADVLPGEWNIDPADARRKMTRRTTALIAVHTFGFPARINELKKLGVVVVEDCAHAIGRLQNGFALGARGDISITSFYATKLVGAGEGGAVLTNDRTIATKVRQWRDYFDQPMSATRLNDKMTDIEAVLGLCQLGRLPDLLDARRNRAHRYTTAFGRLAHAGRIEIPAAIESRIWYRYVVRVPGVPSRELCAALASRRISAAEPICDWREKGQSRQPIASLVFRELVSLPLYPTLTRVEQSRVIEAVRGFLE
jgi:perosamine synthetase